MRKKAIVEIILVSEADKGSNKQIARDIGQSLKCDWLAEVKKITIGEPHHRMPNGKETYVFPEKPV